MKSTKIGLVNFGGGTGKTTTAYWMARYWAQKEIDTLMLDTDAQGCMTAKLLGIPDDKMVEDTLGERTIANVLEGNATLNDITFPATFSAHIKVAGADKYLVSTMDRLLPKAGSNLLLRKAIKREQDLSCKATIIDSAPDADKMIENVLYAADVIVIPATPEAKSVRGLLTVLEMVKIVRADRMEDSDGADAGPIIAGVVICDVGRSLGHAKYTNKLKELAVQIADENGESDDCYMTDSTGNPCRGVLGVIPRYEGKKADTDLWMAYMPTCDNIYCIAGL